MTEGRRRAVKATANEHGTEAVAVQGAAGGYVVTTKRSRSGGTVRTIRGPDGSTVTSRTSAATQAKIERIAKTYRSALSRLADK